MFGEPEVFWGIFMTKCSNFTIWLWVWIVYTITKVTHLVFLKKLWKDVTIYNREGEKKYNPTY